jgi:pimeloyl-ACP methyl ester carboxylesterase
MSSGEMAEFANGFKPARPVIVIDQRAHGRSTGVSAPLSYPQLGDDAAGVVTALGLERVDVIGYSMGGGAALNMAVRHPERIGKLVVLSATYRRDGWYPEVMETIGGLTAEVMANTPMRTEYQRLSPTPDSFVVYFERVKALNYAEHDMPEEQVRAIEAPTMVIIGDADGVRPEHAISLFRLRGGGDTNAAAMGLLAEPPKARLMILPAAGHLGLLAMVREIVAEVEAFLSDARPRLPAGYGGGGH